MVNAILNILSDDVVDHRKHSHDGLFGDHGWLHDVEGCPSCHSAARLVLGNYPRGPRRLLVVALP